MNYDKMTHEEAVALVNFVVERVKQLDRKPILFGRRKWEENLLSFKCNFLDVLKEGKNNFRGAIWQFFEERDDLFLGENGLLELAEHTSKEGDSWVYRNWYKNIERVIYTA